MILIIPFMIFRCKRWIANIRRADLDNEDVSKFFKTRVICSDHFENTAYNNPSDRHSSRLLPSAVPTLINCPNPPKSSILRRRILVRDQKQGPSPAKRKCLDNQVLEEPSTSTAVLNSVSSRDHSNHNCKYRQNSEKFSRMKNLNRKLYCKINRLQAKVRQLERQKSYQNNYRFERNDYKLRSGQKKPVPEAVQEFIDTQNLYFTRKKKGMRWSAAHIKLSLSIYYKSPATYRFLSSIFGMPSESTLYQRMRETMMSSGICKRTLLGVKYKSEGQTKEENCCVVTFDGMKIKKSVELMKNDQINGFEELHNDRRTSKLASELLVFMVQGIYRKWKQPVAYFFVNSPARKDMITEILSDLLKELTLSGLNVMAIICDQETIHQQLVKDCEGHFNGIPMLFDVPHLFKSLRNSLLKYNIKVSH